MMKLVLLAGFAALMNAGEPGAVSREVVYQGDISPLNIKPTLDSGYLIVWAKNPDGTLGVRRIAVYRPDGSKAYETTIELPGARVLVRNGAVDSDGTVAVTLEYRAPGLGGGFALLDQAGIQTRFVPTGSYIPEQICFAPDHNIWLTGSPHNAERDTADYMIFRKYSNDGDELGRFVPRSQLGGDLESVSTIGGRALRASTDRVVALLQSANGDPGNMTWVEVDLTGRLIGRPGQHRTFYPWALAPDGTIYANEAEKFVFYNRAAGAWQPVAGIPAGHLMGADGEGLVFLLPRSSTLRWVRPTQ